jgi:hypothetical protein
MLLTQSVFHQSRRRAICDGFAAEDADISGASRRRRHHSVSAGRAANDVGPEGILVALAQKIG